MRIRFDEGSVAFGSDFQTPTQIITVTTLAELAPAFARLEAAQRSGHWLAGYARYELGYLFEPRLCARLPTSRRLPLLQFGVYGPPQQTPRLEIYPVGKASLSRFVPLWDQADYATTYQVVRGYIAAGDIYQANLTFLLRAVNATPSAVLYNALSQRQPVKFDAFIEQRVLPDILSLSPELFFRTNSKGRIQSRPMKDTQPRVSDPVADQANRDFLTADSKDRAENLMIVDLLRNDLS